MSGEKKVQKFKSPLSLNCFFLNNLPSTSITISPLAVKISELLSNTF